MKNHYVPQFVIKQFNQKPYFFDIEKGEVLSRQAHKVFWRSNMYSDEIEIKINQQVESRFARQVRDKLAGGDITLTRAEVELTKRYMLLASVRTMGETDFSKKMRQYAPNAKCYLELTSKVDLFEGFTLGNKPTIEELNLDDRALYMLALERFTEDETAQQLLLDQSLPLEMYVWAIPFTASYITIWDAPEGRQFILTDCGMNTEYEGMRHFIGRDISKYS